MAQTLIGIVSEMANEEINQKEKDIRDLNMFVRSQLLSALEKNRVFVRSVKLFISLVAERDLPELKLAYEKMSQEISEFFKDNEEGFESIQEDSSKNAVRLCILKFTKFKFKIKDFCSEIFKVFALMAEYDKLQKEFAEYQELFYEILENSFRVKDTVFQAMVQTFEDLITKINSFLNCTSKNFVSALHDILKEAIFCEHANSIVRLILLRTVDNDKFGKLYYQYETMDRGRVIIQNNNLHFLGTLLHPGLVGQSFELLRTRFFINCFLNIAELCDEGQPTYEIITSIASQLKLIGDAIGNGDIQQFLNNLMAVHDIHNIGSLTEWCCLMSNLINEFLDEHYYGMSLHTFLRSIDIDRLCRRPETAIYYGLSISMQGVFATLSVFQTWTYDFPISNDKMVIFNSTSKKEVCIPCQVI